MAFDPYVPFVYYPQLLIAIALLLLIIHFISSKSRPIYLIDYACYRAPAYLRASTATFIEHTEICGYVLSESIDFLTKMIERSGIGPETCFPNSLHQIPHGHSLAHTREETEAVLFTVVKDLLDKHKINPKEIDILVTNCSIFCPTPSISATIVNKFRFRGDVKSVSLSGMGCSAGLVAINLAKDLLRVNKNSMALVLSMEAVTPNGYEGKNKSMLLANTLFRMGGVAILQSVFQKNDDTGNIGVSLSRSLLHVAANARISRRRSSISACTLVDGR